MGYHDRSTGSVIARLFGGRSNEVQAMPVLAGSEMAEVQWGDGIRAELLTEINDFLLRNRLDVTPRNLGLAHAIKTGSDLWLCEKLAEREMSGRPVTQDWLDGVASATGDKEAMLDSIGQMMDKLEGSMNQFERSARQASTTSDEYREEFANQMAAARDLAPQAINRRFLELSQNMLETLQRIDKEMRRSQSETAELRESLQQARADAENDHLTRLPNRRAFEQRFAQFHQNAQQLNQRLYVAICDVDHFKLVNDNFGHETGDGLLRAIASALKQIASGNCFVARHGGEEFVLLFRDCSREDVVAQIERVQRSLKERKFIARRSGEAVGPITFSAGIADVMAEPDPRAALSKADQALYRAKEAGRDRVVCA